MEFNCEGQDKGNNGGIMMYNYVLDHRDLGEQFLKLIGNGCNNPTRGSCSTFTCWHSMERAKYYATYFFILRQKKYFLVIVIIFWYRGFLE